MVLLGLAMGYFHIALNHNLTQLQWVVGEVQGELLQLHKALPELAETSDMPSVYRPEAQAERAKAAQMRAIRVKSIIQKHQLALGQHLEKWQELTTANPWFVLGIQPLLGNTAVLDSLYANSLSLHILLKGYDPNGGQELEAIKSATTLLAATLAEGNVFFAQLHERLQALYLLLLIGWAVVTGALALGAVLLFSEEVIRPVGHLARAMADVARGKPVSLSVMFPQLSAPVGSQNDPNSGHEVHQLAHAVDHYQQYLEKITHFASDIGQQHEVSSTNYQFSTDDQLGTALLKMRDKLLQTSLEDKKRGWINEGLTQYAEILRANSHDQDDLADQTLRFVVGYLEANQGGLFLKKIQDEQPCFVLKSSYAYHKKKFRQKTFKVGEGLLGQVLIDERLIHVKNVPHDYMEITSGLGDDRPDQVVIVPLKFNDRLYGCMELASFHAFEPHQVAFLEKIAENIAASLATVEAADETRKLLAASQEYANELKIKEETMKQNLEELATTQEEMKRVQKSMQLKEKQLEKLLGSTHSHILLFDQQLRLNYFNRAVYQFIFAEGKHLRPGISYREIIPLSGDILWCEKVVKALRGEASSMVNTISVNASAMYMFTNFQPVFSEKGVVEGVSVFSHDITKLNPVRWD